MIKMISGNLIELADQGNFDCIAHQCNINCIMGGGLAYYLKIKWPEVYAADCRTTRGDISKMGECSVANVKVANGSLLTVYNVYAQSRIAQYYGDCVTDYEALRSGLKVVSSQLGNDKLGLPYKIGCGLAHGNWDIVYQIIEDVFKDQDVTIVNFI